MHRLHRMIDRAGLCCSLFADFNKHYLPCYSNATIHDPCRVPTARTVAIGWLGFSRVVSDMSSGDCFDEKDRPDDPYGLNVNILFTISTSVTLTHQNYKQMEQV